MTTPTPSLEALFEAMWPKLVVFFRRRGAADPENEAANTLLRVVQAKPAALTAHYIWQAAWGVLVDSYRRASVRPIFSELRDVHMGADPTSRLCEVLDLQTALASLTEQQRFVVTQHANGYALSQLGLPESGAKKLNRRGIARLRRALAA